MTAPSIRILNIEPADYSAEARSVLSRCGLLVEKELSRTELLREISDVHVLVVRLAHSIDAEVIDAGRSLLAIVSATTGLDHIDVEHARERGVGVLSLRGETEFLRSVTATAEHTWGLLLALTRRLVTASNAVCEGEWDRDALRGHDLKGRRLGVLGLGRIGRMVARYGRAFEMEVAAYDPHAPEWLEGVERAATLEQLLQSSDVLSIHVPLDASTKGLLGAAELAQLPLGALVINTSRGDIVDADALVEALRNRRLAGAALDVIPAEREPDRRLASPLLAYAREHAELLVTPHIGGATWESMARTELFMARKLEAFLEGASSAGRPNDDPEV